jgi:hypothetical protein
VKPAGWKLLYKHSLTRPISGCLSLYGLIPDLLPATCCATLLCLAIITTLSALTPDQAKIYTYVIHLVP